MTSKRTELCDAGDLAELAHEKFSIRPSYWRVRHGQDVRLGVSHGRHALRLQFGQGWILQWSKVFGECSLGYFDA